jgi:amidase
LGSETDGSIVCPGNANGVVALKPTVGLVSRAGGSADFPYAGHSRTACPDSGRRCRNAWRHPEPRL